MNQIVNFLPWRETRRRQRLQMGGLLTAGLLLILLAVLLASRLNKGANHSLEKMRISADDQLYTAFQQCERAMRQRLQQQEQRRLRQLRREKTAAWQPRLQALAARLPEQVWLTQLEYRQNTLMLSGLTLNLKGIAALEKMLGNITGFRPPKAGNTHRDSEGRWLFHFFMAGEDENAGGN
jgi:pilus assembly protein HofN